MIEDALKRAPGKSLINSINLEDGEERFQRVDRDHLEWTVTIDDPKMYTQPWVALDKLPFYLQPPNLDVREMICSPSDSAAYDKLIGNPASDKSHK